MNDTAQETTAVMTLPVEHELLGTSLLPVGNKINFNCVTSHISHCISPHSTIPVGSVVLFGIVSVGIPVGDGVIILHTTWEGSGLHLSSSPHTELRIDGVNPG